MNEVRTQLGFIPIGTGPAYIVQVFVQRGIVLMPEWLEFIELNQREISYLIARQGNRTSTNQEKVRLNLMQEFLNFTRNVLDIIEETRSELGIPHPDSQEQSASQSPQIYAALSKDERGAILNLSARFGKLSVMSEELAESVPRLNTAAWKRANMPDISKLPQFRTGGVIDEIGKNIVAVAKATGEISKTVAEEAGSSIGKIAALAAIVVGGVLLLKVLK